MRIRAKDACSRFHCAVSSVSGRTTSSSSRDVSTQEPARAFELERAAAVKLQKMGVKLVSDVDKSGFQTIADPYLDSLAAKLGPHAEKIKTLIRAIN